MNLGALLSHTFCFCWVLLCVVGPGFLVYWPKAHGTREPGMHISRNSKGVPKLLINLNDGTFGVHAGSLGVSR